MAKKWDPISGMLIDDDPFPYKPPKFPTLDDFSLPKVNTRPYDPFPFPKAFTPPPEPPRIKTPPYPYAPVRTPPPFPRPDPLNPFGPGPGLPPIGSLPPPKIGS